MRRQTDREEKVKRGQDVVKKVVQVPSSLSVPRMKGDSTQLGRHSHKHIRTVITMRRATQRERKS